MALIFTKVLRQILRLSFQIFPIWKVFSFRNFKFQILSSSALHVLGFVWLSLEGNSIFQTQTCCASLKQSSP